MSFNLNPNGYEKAMDNSAGRDSLALISASYDSSDSDSVISSRTQDFTVRQTETLSSTTNSEDSDSEDSESDLESIIQRKPSFIPKRIRVKGELCDQDLPPIEDLHISVKEEECLPFGKVYSIVDTLLVIQSLSNKPALNLDSVFFRHNGTPVGRVFDVFGPVQRPFYSVRFNTNKEIIDKGLIIDMVLYAAPHTPHAEYVFTQHLMKEKGSDASWVNDCEPPLECLDYSDDEQERSNTRKQKKSVPIKQEVMEDEVVVKKKYLSFEERMNENNAMRNKYFNKTRPDCSTFNSGCGLDSGWHNRINWGSVKSNCRVGGATTRIRSPVAAASTNGGSAMFQMRAPLFRPPAHPQTRWSPPTPWSPPPPHFTPDYRLSFPPATFDSRYPPPSWPNSSNPLHPAPPLNTSIHFSPSGTPPLQMPPNTFYNGSTPAYSFNSPQRPPPPPPTSASPHQRFYFPNYTTGLNSFQR